MCLGGHLLADPGCRKAALVDLEAETRAFIEMENASCVGSHRLCQHEVARTEHEIRRIARKLDIGCATGSGREMEGGGKHHAVAPGVRREDDAALPAMAGDRREAGYAAGQGGVRLQDVVAAVVDHECGFVRFA